MIQHYLKIALRNLSRQKGLAFINVLGLSIGLACFILFMLYAVNEFSFDRFHKNSANIYRVYGWWQAMNGNEASGTPYLPMPLGPAMKEELPEVENYVRFRESWGQSFIKADGKITREDIVYADPQIFDLFSFELKSGDHNALIDPHHIVLTEATATKLFGHANAVGKTIEIKMDDRFQPFVVSAIAKDPPVNSSIQFKMLASFEYFENSEEGKWGKNEWHRSAFLTFVKVKDKSRLADDKKKLLAFYQKHNPEEEAELRKKGIWKRQGAPATYGLQPLLAIHTQPKLYGGFTEPVNPKTIWLLLGIAAVILFIACINFTTLAIGRSAGRAKEVGIRKVIGSRRKDLLVQFLTEAFLLTILSTALGLLLGKLLLPYFNQLSGRELQFSFTYYPELLWLILGLMIIVGLLAGSYPSLILSRFKPVEVLKSKLKVGGSNFFTRSLVTVQFVLSVGLMISTLIIMKQLKFMRSKNPGFNKENIVVIDAGGVGNTKKTFALFKEQALKNPAIKGIASAELGLGEGTGWSRSGFEYQGKHKDVYEYYVDNEYLKVLNIPLLAGRNFDPQIASDTVNSVIVNEALVKDFGWTIENAVGQQIKGYNEQMTPVVIGVVKDFHYRPFSEKVLPQLFHQYASYQPYKFFVRIQPGYPSKSLASLGSIWKSIVPDLPFKYDFLDESLDRFYKSETRWSQIVGWAGGISIFLACLGLLGLAALAAVNRTKEIGIRKVLGASVSNIVALLSKDFLKLVLIAFVIASPLAWYFMNKWLQDFAYRINIGWWVFFIAGASALLIALVTISFQAMKAALSNPVKSLRTE
jgi:putative ABC transport system permease protein